MKKPGPFVIKIESITSGENKTAGNPIVYYLHDIRKKGINFDRRTVFRYTYAEVGSQKDITDLKVKLVPRACKMQISHKDYSI